MYLHMLSQDEQELFIRLAILLKNSDDEILWDGKRFEEITGETDLEKISFLESPQEQAVLAGFVRDLDKLNLKFQKDASTLITAIRLRREARAFTTISIDSQYEFSYHSQNEFQHLFGQLLGKYPLPKQNDTTTRLEVCSRIINPLMKSFNEDKECSTAGKKIIVYELFSLVLADGVVSDIEKSIINIIADNLGIDSLDIDELFEAAQELNKLVVKALSLILE